MATFSQFAYFRTRDAAVLEFDAFCSHGQLNLEIQFGSEEYDEWVSENFADGCFNDAFMVTVDNVVISVLPDCSDIIAVNTVHPAISVANSRCLLADLPASQAHLYLDDDIDIDPRVAPANQPVQVEYDGMTIRLWLHVFLTPGENHHIEIAVADVDGNNSGDNTLDSALFVRAASVRTIPPVP